jgi:hypothetical protein
MNNHGKGSLAGVAGSTKVFGDTDTEDLLTLIQQQTRNQHGLNNLILLELQLISYRLGVLTGDTKTIDEIQQESSSQ